MNFSRTLGIAILISFTIFSGAVMTLKIKELPKDENIERYVKSETEHVKELFTMSDRVNEEIEIKEDERISQKINFVNTTDVKIEIENLTSNDAEIFVFEEAEYLNYIDGVSSTSVYYSLPGMYSFEETLSFEGGQTYYIVVDNTDYGTIIPPFNFSDDTVKINFKISY